jgi:serine/threonine-protein kinase
MKYAGGGSLDKRLEGRPLQDGVAAMLIKTLALAIQYAHEHGVIHRDLKPANLLLEGSKDTPLAECTILVSDFGLAKDRWNDKGLTKNGCTLGTAHYMAPEQAAGNSKQAGPAVDIYSSGSILYELVTGQPPFAANTDEETIVKVQTDEPLMPTSLNPALDERLEAICWKCLRKAPSERYQTAMALAEDLGRFLSGEPVLAPLLVAR